MLVKVVTHTPESSRQQTSPQNSYWTKQFSNYWVERFATLSAVIDQIADWQKKQWSISSCLAGRKGII